jgi:AraC family transcriptional activator of pobA
MTRHPPLPVTPVRFLPTKYGRPLAIDSSRFEHWTGIVPDGQSHRLDFHECLVVSRGAAHFQIDGHGHEVRGPAVVFTAARAVRVIELSDALSLRLVVFTGAASVRPFSSGVIHVEDPGALSPLEHIGSLMTRELAAPRPDSGAMLDALLTQFLITLARAGAPHAPRTPPLVARFERLLDTRFCQDHDVAAYAAALSVSPDHLSAALRHHHGLSAKAAIDRRLFIEAVRLLESSPLTIAAISDALGFDEPTHFTRAFTRMCGVSPRRYRETR